MINRLGNLSNTAMTFILFALHSSLFLFMYIVIASAERAHHSGETSMLEWFLFPSLFSRLIVVIVVAHLVSRGSWAGRISPYVLPLSILPTIFVNLAFISPLQRWFGFCSGGISIVMFFDAIVLGLFGVVLGLIYAIIVSRR